MQGHANLFRSSLVTDVLRPYDSSMSSDEFEPKMAVMAKGQDSDKEYPSFAGQLLVATPQLDESRFERSVILLCAHNEEGALGVVLNEPLDGIMLTSMLEQLDISADALDEDAIIFNGGPVAENRGFVVHSNEVSSGEDMEVPGGYRLSSSLEALRLIASGKGPRDFLIALGYSGWDAGQLESEIVEDSWHIVDADQDLVFHIDREQVWNAALSKVGIADTGRMSSFVGNA